MLIAAVVSVSAITRDLQQHKELAASFPAGRFSLGATAVFNCSRRRSMSRWAPPCARGRRREHRQAGRNYCAKRYCGHSQ